jgi:Ser/Thr protein kinase RdoA (MazF antagonist)
MAFTDKDKEELKSVQARRASGVPSVPGTAPDRARDPRRQVPSSASELAALGRVHESVKADRTARESDEWYSGNEGAKFRDASYSTGSVKVIKGGSGGPSGTVVPSITGIPGRN